MPRRQQSRPTSSANGGSSASSLIAWSSESRRVFARSVAADAIARAGGAG
jgi:hypothetical protein